MNDQLNQVGERAKKMLAGFTTGQRAIVVVAVLALGLGAFALSRWAAQPDWAPLYVDLTQAKASAIVTQLEADGVQYQYGSGGSTIMVPKAQVAAVRVSLAGKGITTGGADDSGGYAILDKQGMTSTDLQQSVAVQRALEGELNRTLKAINGVNTAIVHIAIPKKDVFTTETDHPTASVLLDLATGTTLSRAQIRSVMHLVAGTVPGLDASDVTVTDADGNMLSVREDGQGGSVAAATEADQQTQAFEDAKTEAAQKVLDATLGKGKAVVRVNAELNFDASRTTSKRYGTATSAPTLNRATSSESYGMQNAGPGGVMGFTSPTLTPGLGANGGGTYVKVQDTSNFGVDEYLNETTAAPGAVKRLTIAVVLDSKAAAGTTDTAIQDVVTNAVGYDAQRGDQVKVTQIPFDTTASEAAKKELAQAQAAAKTAQYVDLGKKAGIGLLALIVAIVMMRRRRKAAPPEQTRVEAVATDLPEPPALLATSMDEQLAISSAAQEAREAQAAEALDKSLERELLRDEVAKFVDQQPEEIAAIVQGWLGQRKN